MNIYSHFKSLFFEIFIKVTKFKYEDFVELKNKFTVELPRDETHGDISTNISLVFAKQSKINPRELAKNMKPFIEKLDGVNQVSIEGPGFININLKDSFWHNQLENIINLNEKYGESSTFEGKNINVEFISANPTGPLHVGHVRGAVIGDVLSNILKKVGFNVTKEYYINDAGNQIDTLAQSVFLRYKEIITKDKIEIPEGYYPGDYLIPIAKELHLKYKADLLGDDKNKATNLIKDFSINYILNLIKNDLKLLNIEMDVYSSEKKLVEDLSVQKTIKELEIKNLIYFGSLPTPKSINDDWEPKDQTLFKAKLFGDDEDRTVIKSDGSLTYFASDIAYHRDKLIRTKGTLINIWGADHSGYVKRMTSAVKALTDMDNQLEIKLCQMVNLLKDNKPIKMSKRSGNFITLKDIINEVGGDAIRFIMLTRKNDQVLDFDFNKVTEKTKENPVFYVKYAHARICSVLKKANELGYYFERENLNLKYLNHDIHLKLCRQLSNWPKIIETSAIYKEPHRIAFYLIELSSIFHSLWSLGREKNELRFFQKDDIDCTYAYLNLIKATKIVIASGLNIMSVSAPEEM